MILCARLDGNAATQVKAEIKRRRRREEDMGAEDMRSKQKQSEWITDNGGKAADLGHVSYHVDTHASLSSDFGG